MLKGTVVYELFQLLGYWRKTLSSSHAHAQSVQKIPFGPHSSQYLILFSPKKLDPSKPLLLYYHGGGWIFGKPELFAKKAAIFNALGYQVIMPSYRKVPLYHSSHIIEDIHLCLAKIKQLQSDDHVIQSNSILLGGVSAGASLVSLIYFQQEALKNLGFSQEQFKGIFLFAPPMDLDKMKKSIVLYRYAGKKGSKRYTQASPINFIQRSFPIPILCVHGTKDGLVDYSASQSFKQLYNELHPGYLDYVSLENKSHLDAASWAHSDNEIRKLLLDWIQKIE